MPKIYDIITHPNEILRKKSEEIDISKIKSAKMKIFLSDMKETMLEKDGVGLATPQIGKNIRIIIVNNNGEITTMINPKITKKSWARKIAQEGCLSIPNVFGDVKRHKKIKCVFYDESGEKKSLAVSDLPARIIQHEIDHLEGILFIDKLEKKF